MSDTSQTVSSIHFLYHMLPGSFSTNITVNDVKDAYSNKCFLFNKRPLYNVNFVLDAPASNKHPLSNRRPHDNYSKILGISKKEQNHCILFNVN